MTLVIDGAKLKINPDKTGFGLAAVFRVTPPPADAYPLLAPMTLTINKSGTKFSTILSPDIWVLDAAGRQRLPDLRGR